MRAGPGTKAVLVSMPLPSACKHTRRGQGWERGSAAGQGQVSRADRILSPCLCNMPASVSPWAPLRAHICICGTGRGSHSHPDVQGTSCPGLGPTEATVPARAASLLAKHCAPTLPRGHACECTGVLPCQPSLLGSLWGSRHALKQPGGCSALHQLETALMVRATSCCTAGTPTWPRVL